MKWSWKRPYGALALAAGLVAANVVAVACGTDPTPTTPPNQQFSARPTLTARPVVYGFFTDTNASAASAMSSLATLGAHVLVVPATQMLSAPNLLTDDQGVAAMRQAQNEGVSGYLGLVLDDANAVTTGDASDTPAPTGTPDDAFCNRLVAASTARFDVLHDAAPDLRGFYLPQPLTVTSRSNFGDLGCLPDASVTIAHYLREAGASDVSLAIGPTLDDNAEACDDVCADDIATSWGTFLKTAQIDVVMLNDGVLSRGVTPAVARTYLTPMAAACASAGAAFYIDAESLSGATRANAAEFFARLDLYADAGIVEAGVITHSAVPDAAWVCGDYDAGCSDDLAACQAARLSGSACP